VRIFQISHEEGQNGTKANTRMKEREKSSAKKDDDTCNDAFGSHAGNPKANHWLIMRGSHRTVKIRCVKGNQGLRARIRSCGSVQEPRSFTPRL
ncbi:hypothetical protein Tco_1335252, partial [Tanacetum coccineum]